MTIFLVEQNANQALKLADRGYVLENGRVVLSDTGDALLANEAVRARIWAAKPSVSPGGAALTPGLRIPCRPGKAKPPPGFFSY